MRMKDMATESQQPLFEVEGLSFSYGRHSVLKDVSLQLSAGITVLLGQNGAGKTTLLESLSRLRRKEAKGFRLGGQDVTRGTRREVQRFVGFMPQGWSPMPGFSALESVKYAAWLKGAHSADQNTLAHDALQQVGLQGEARIKATRLSGGQQRRVGLAEAVVMSPKILLLDEPTVGLDPLHRNRFREALTRYGATSSVLLSTHLTEDTDVLADRVLVLHKGKLVFDGTTQALRRAGGETVGSAAGSTAQLEAGYLQLIEQAS